MNYMDSFEWLLCPVCNSKTRIKLRLDTELKNFPLFCPKCKQETLISVHLLARFTSYVNVKMGTPSQFDVYVDRERKGNTFDIEHILPDDYMSSFSQPLGRGCNSNIKPKDGSKIFFQMSH